MNLGSACLQKDQMSIYEGDFTSMLDLPVLSVPLSSRLKKCMLPLVLGVSLLCSCSAGNKAADFVLVPVADPATEVHYPGKFVWNDLLTDNVPVAKDFYGRLFGWTFETTGNYTVVKNNDRSIAGIAYIKRNDDRPVVSRWLCTLSVEDVDKAAAMFLGEGGVVNEGPLELTNRGLGALVRDPHGAQLMILSANGGDPEDEEPALGSWLWHELWSNRPNESLAFYQKLAGYGFEGDPEDYLILTKEAQWRAGIRYVDNNELEMRWVPVVRVANTQEISERASQLGGKIRVEPQPTGDGGSVALLSDPSDALVIIQQWTAPVPEKED